MLGYTAPPSLMQCSIHPVCWSKYTTNYFSGVEMYNSLFFKCTVERQTFYRVALKTLEKVDSKMTRNLNCRKNLNF